MLGKIAADRKLSVDYQRIWNAQAVDETLSGALAVIAKAVSDDITQPPAGISNISEWCKKEGCWGRLSERSSHIADLLDDAFWSALIGADDNREEAKTARQTQKIDNGIEAQKRVFDTPASHWSKILREAGLRKLLTPKDIGILKIAEQIPAKVPTERQSALLVQLLDRAQQEGILPD
jgi:hypothetical protein